MSAEYSVEEVRDRAFCMERDGYSYVAELLLAYAERIKADERAVPVAGTPERQLFDLAHAWGDNKIHNYQLMHRIENIVEKLRATRPPAQADQFGRVDLVKGLMAYTSVASSPVETKSVVSTNQADNVDKDEPAQAAQPKIIATMMHESSRIYGVEFTSEGGAEIYFRTLPATDGTAVNGCVFSSSHDTHPVEPAAQVDLIREAYRAGFIEACGWGSPVTGDMGSAAFDAALQDFLGAAPTADPVAQVECDHEWMAYFTGSQQTHWVCAHCNNKQPSIALPAPTAKVDKINDAFTVLEKLGWEWVSGRWCADIADPEPTDEPVAQEMVKKLQAQVDALLELAEIKDRRIDSQSRMELGEPVAQGEAVSVLVRTAPEQIYLQIDDDGDYSESEPFPADHAEITWCTDSVVSREVKYIRADLAAQPRAVPDGWVPVPCEPTLGMVQAAMVWLTQYTHMRKADKESALAEAIKSAITARPARCAGMNGIELIAAERHRQIEAEGFDAAHDAQEEPGVLTMAAVCYATMSASSNSMREELRKGADHLVYWPWAPQWWKPGAGDTHEDRIRELAKAGGLIAAEIDRLNASIIVERADRTPTFDELQAWALAHGWTGATDQEAFDAWRENREAGENR